MTFLRWFRRWFRQVNGNYPYRKVASVLHHMIERRGIEIRMVAPSHGPIWRKNPSWIIDRYARWSRHEAEEGVVIAYASMYGNTERMMEAVAHGLSEEEAGRIRIHDASRTHVSYLIRDAWRFRALILGSPTYDADLFPPMRQFIDLLEHKKLSKRVLGLFGSSSWSGGGVRILEDFAKRCSWELTDPIVEARCAPTEDNLRACVLLGQRIVRRLKTNP